MCWNKDVSLNTFVFSIGMLCIMMYNDRFTIYKTGFDYYWYFFIVSFCTMQLIEYFLWTNLNTPITAFYSFLGQLLVTIQPIASLFLLKNHTLRNIFIIIYLLFCSLVYATHKKVFKTTVEDGHLKWTWVPIETYIYFVWLFFLLFSFIVNRHYFAIAIALFLFTITYNTKGTGGSLWCWSINFTMIFYAVYLLIYLPLKEKLC